MIKFREISKVRSLYDTRPLVIVIYNLQCNLSTAVCGPLSSFNSFLVVPRSNEVYNPLNRVVFDRLVGVVLVAVEQVLAGHVRVEGVWRPALARPKGLGRSVKNSFENQFTLTSVFCCYHHLKSPPKIAAQNDFLQFFHKYSDLGRF